MGPTSPLWSGFVGVDGSALYSIAIARTPGLTDAHGNTVNSVVPTNITIGAANSGSYTGTSLSITANSANTYDLNYLGFGKVYQNSDGVDTSAYFESLNSSFPVTFTTNF
jgi:hypothetical protein